MTADLTRNQSTRPFPAATDTSRYFPASHAEESRERLSRAIAHSEGPALVIGAAGTGKSLLLEVLAAQFRDQRAVVTLIGAQLCTRKALLQMILFEIGLPYRGMDEGELRLSLVEFLRPREGSGNRMLLLVDEADSLPTRLLQELRVLTNLSDQGQPQVNLVLAGSALLEEHFADPQLEVFSQRIAVRCYLVPLGREETFQYVRSQTAASGCNVDELFTNDGLEAIFSATDGLPRLINQLGNQLVWMAAETGCQPLDGTIVQQAWSELQQLPAPWYGPTADATSNVESARATVEFGELVDTLGDDPGCGDRPEEELPASIPFAVKYNEDSSPPDSQIKQVKSLDAVDATEKLLHELSQMDEPAPTEPTVDDPPTAHNPFDEAFVTEEVVLDQYASFDAQLFKKAQQVFNHQDVRFAEDLSCCESDDVDSDPCDIAPPTGSGFESSSARSNEHQLATFPSDGMPAEEAVEKVALDESLQESRGSVLVVDPDESSSFSVVQGKQFRQLFSQLESRNDLP